MVEVIAHRGARSLAPENSLVAAKIAYDLGADLWETDVNLTKDNELILCHDKDLTRCSDVQDKFPGRSSYLISEFTCEEINCLDLGSHFNSTDPFSQIKNGQIGKEVLAAFVGEPIPNLEQALLLTKKLDWKINIELKYFPDIYKNFYLPEKVLETIKNNDIRLDQVIISSFNHGWLRKIEKIIPEVEVQALVGGNDIDPLDFEDYYFETYNANAKLITKSMIQRLKNKGKKINLFIINDPDEFQYFSGLGVDGIFTDFPQRFKKQFK